MKLTQRAAPTESVIEPKSLQILSMEENLFHRQAVV